MGFGLSGGGHRLLGLGFMACKSSRATDYRLVLCGVTTSTWTPNEGFSESWKFQDFRVAAGF